MRNNNSSDSIDWVAILLFLALVLLGWLNIYAAEYDPEKPLSIFSISTSAGRQLIWIGTSVAIAYVISLIDYKLFDSMSYVIYIVFVLMLISVLLIGSEKSGSKSWFGVGSFGLQPSEFAKFATALALARYLADPTRKITTTKDLVLAFVLIGLPMILTILQGDTGTALVFSSLLIPLFREGMDYKILLLGLVLFLVFISTLLVNQIVLLIAIGVIVLLGIGLNTRNYKMIIAFIVGGILLVASVKSVDFVLNDVLKPHQQKRIMSLVNPNIDPLGIGWNVTQSKIAIGSGGAFGKGFLQGTQTKFDFVPEQTTDFIFCTIGEEHGWLGAMVVIILFVGLLFRLSFLAERQKSIFSRVYGYGVIAILFFHFTINIGMTIGVFPVIGIPLPFFSYGGSSLWAFTILLFSFLKLDASRVEMLQRW